MEGVGSTRSVGLCLPELPWRGLWCGDCACVKFPFIVTQDFVRLFSFETS